MSRRHDPLRPIVISHLESLSEGIGEVPLMEAVNELDRYPDLDEDAGVNHIVGWLHGCARGRGHETVELLLEDLQIPLQDCDKSPT